jgi:ABC-2 type transport system permease protein
MTRAIETIGLTKTYGSVTAAADLNLRVEPGQVFGFLGPNGVGKSVVLYPSLRHQTSLNSLSGSTAAAPFGITGKLTSPGGWLNANIYGNFFPLIMLLLTVGAWARGMQSGRS